MSQWFVSTDYTPLTLLVLAMLVLSGIFAVGSSYARDFLRKHGDLSEPGGLKIDENDD